MNSTCGIIYDGDFSGRLVRVDQVAVPVECRQPEGFFLRNQEVVKFVITVEMGVEVSVFSMKHVVVDVGVWTELVI